MVHLTPPQFEALVEDALDELPAEIRSRMDNIVVTIADWPAPTDLVRAGAAAQRQLFGLYEGIPLTRRLSSYGLVAPDKITLYRGPLQAASVTPDELRQRVVCTVIHEIAHHFGIDDARILELSSENKCRGAQVQ